jgi:hypothetical protein
MTWVSWNGRLGDAKMPSRFGRANGSRRNEQVLGVLKVSGSYTTKGYKVCLFSVCVREVMVRV